MASVDQSIAPAVVAVFSLSCQQSRNSKSYPTMAVRKPSKNLLKPNYHTLSSGIVLHRVHSCKYAGNTFNDRADVEGRFNPVYDTEGNVVPVLYATDSLESAVCETIFHDQGVGTSKKTVRKLNVERRNHSQIILKSEITLVSLRQQDLQKWGIRRNELIASPSKEYCHTVKWAQEIYTQFDKAQGLVWTSNQCDPDSAFMFFGTRIPTNCFEIEKMREGADDISFVQEVISIGMRSNIRVID